MTYGVEAFGTVVVVGLAAYLRGYITTKTRPLATSDDLAALASTIDAIRASFRIQEGSLHAALERDVATLEARFRVELPIYRETWDHCLAVSSALVRVRRPNGGPPCEDTYQAFRRAFELLQSSVRRFDPFFAPEVTLAILGASLPTDGAGADVEIERESRGVATAVELLKTDIRDRLRADVRAVVRLRRRPKLDASSAP